MAHPLRINTRAEPLVTFLQFNRYVCLHCVSPALNHTVGGIGVAGDMSDEQRRHSSMSSASWVTHRAKGSRVQTRYFCFGQNLSRT